MNDVPYSYIILLDDDRVPGGYRICTVVDVCEHQGRIGIEGM